MVRRFLVVDDSATVRLMVKSAIARAVQGAVDVVQAADADEALRAFEAGAPEVVFLDMVLGTGAGGGTVLERMLAQAPEARVVLVTGLHPEHPDVVAAVSMGAAGLLRKPVRAEEVAEILSTLAQESGSAGRIR